MGLYSINESYYTSSVNLDNIDSIVCESEDFIKESYKIAYESTVNYNNIMKAVGIQELAVLESTGEEMIYEAGNYSGFFGKIKEFFINVWKKIKGLFEKFMAFLDRFIASNKDFVKKYRKVVIGKNLDGFEYTGYRFTTNKIVFPSNLDDAVKESINVELKDNLGKDITKDNIDDAIKTASNPADDNNPTAEEITNGAKNICKKFDDNLDDIHDAIRGKVLNSTCKSYSGAALDSSEFSQKVFEILRNNEDTKDDIGDWCKSNAIKILNIISDYSKHEKEVKNTAKTLKKAYDAVIKTLENLNKEFIKAIPNNDTTKTDETALAAASYSVVSKIISALEFASNCYTTINGLKLSAMKAELSQCKAIIAKMVGYRPKNESYSPYDEDDYETGSVGGFLENVNFI